MEHNYHPVNQIQTDWILARKAADPEVTGHLKAGGTIFPHCYTTGWLVCAEGPERGRDHRLRFGYNRIGRRYDLEVCLFEDPAISRDVHCRVAYEEKSNSFYLVPGEGTATYLIVPDEQEAAGTKEVILLESAPLKTGDRFRVGDTTLEFIAYCREGVTWTDKEMV